METPEHHGNILKFRWLGSDNMYLDEPTIQTCRDVIVGCYGGNSDAGAVKNEDGALVWCAENGAWKFAVLLDAHNSIQSAKLVLDMIESEEERITAILGLPVEKLFSLLHRLLIDLFTSEDFKTKCKQIRGETACLICVQRDRFLWWFSIGDCLIYLFHSELAHLGQYALNQRSYYEWIGQVSSFDLPVPCYTSGTRELRKSENQIVMITDGLLECGSRPFENSEFLYESLSRKNTDGQVGIKSNVLEVLKRVDQEKGKDSATMVYWSYDNGNADCAYPTG